MNYLTSETGKPINPVNPLPVRDVGSASEREAVSLELVTFITGAAGFAGKVTFDKAPIANLNGDKVGSFWRKNKRAETSSTAKVTDVVETATSATVTIVDTVRNLEQLFETPSGTARAVIELTDRTGGTLYGFIGGVSASGNTYVLSVYNTPALATQSWVGTLGSFAFEDGTKFEIFSNESSIAWTTGTILTKEVDLKEGLATEGEASFLNGLANGEYAVDYGKGAIFYKKATTGTSDSVSYSVLKTYVTVTVASGSMSVDSELPADITKDTIVPETPSGHLDTLPKALYSTSPTVRTNGQVGTLQADSYGNLKEAEAYAAQAEDNTNGVIAIANKPLAVSTYSCTRFQNLGANATLNVKATAGNVYSVCCHNLNAAERYIQLHNTATTPAGGAVPLYSFPVPALGLLVIGDDFFGKAGVNLSTGIAFAFSTTEATYTAGTATDQMTHIMYA